MSGLFADAENSAGTPPGRDTTAGSASLGGFLALSVISGITIGLAKIVTQLFSIQIGATPSQVALISAMESAGMMLLTIPAGFIVARHGARAIYAIASIGPLLLNLALPLLSAWWLVASARLLIGMCIPFRTVSMNTAFLEQLPRIGHHRAGWYRGSLMLGMTVIGPAFATFAVGHFHYSTCFIIVALLFGMMALSSGAVFPDHAAAHPQKGKPQSFVADIRAMAANITILESCLTEFLAGTAGGLFNSLILIAALALPGLRAEDGVHALFANGLATAAALFLGAKWLSKLNRNGVQAAGFLLVAAGLVSIGLASNLIGLMIGAMLIALGSAQLHMVKMIQMSLLPGAKGKMSGLYQLAQMLGATVGAFGGAALAAFLPIHSVFLLWVPPFLLSALLLSILRARRQARDKPMPPSPPTQEERT